MGLTREKFNFWNDIGLLLGKIFYNSAGLGDTINDSRESFSTSGKLTEVCTVGSATRGGGTWLKRLLQTINGDIVFRKDSQTGVKFNPDSPDWGWDDMLGQIQPKEVGSNTPTLTLVRGTGTNIKAFAFSVGDIIDDVTIHINHRLVPLSDIFAHVHWEHAGTAISGTLELTWYVTYCKGYNQAGETFIAEKTIVQQISVTSITSHPQYAHFIDEFQLSNSGGDATHLDNTKLEVDGLIKIAIKVTQIPTITGAPAGSANEPFILMADIHAKSKSIVTPNKNYPFYT